MSKVYHDETLLSHDVVSLHCLSEVLKCRASNI